MTSTITKHKRDYAKYVPTYDYSQVNNWSMSKEESNAILDEATRLYEAGDREGYYKMLKKLPLAPNMALRMRDEKGKEALVAEGWNLADAEIVYGKNWLDEYMVDCSQTRGKGRRQAKARGRLRQANGKVAAKNRTPAIGKWEASQRTGNWR